MVVSFGIVDLLDVAIEQNDLAKNWYQIWPLYSIIIVSIFLLYICKVVLVPYPLLISIILQTKEKPWNFIPQSSK